MTSSTGQITPYAIAGGLALSLLIVFVYAMGKRKESPQADEQLPEVDLSVFDSPDMPGSGRCMNGELIAMLQNLQHKSGYPVFKNISSGARSPAHNSRVGGVRNSSHLTPTCRAVDIRVPTAAVRDRLVRIAVSLGFRRIGIGRTFIHLDNDPSKSQRVVWGYPAGSPAPFNPFA